MTTTHYLFIGWLNKRSVGFRQSSEIQTSCGYLIVLHLGWAVHYVDGQWVEFRMEVKQTFLLRSVDKTVCQAINVQRIVHILYCTLPMPASIISGTSIKSSTEFCFCRHFKLCACQKRFLYFSWHGFLTAVSRVFM